MLQMVKFAVIVEKAFQFTLTEEKGWDRIYIYPDSFEN